MEKSGNRIEYLDTAKGIGILSVCIVHACTNKETVSDCQMILLIRFLAMFVMAMFFFINGMLYNGKYAQKPLHGMWHKIKAYYIPFVTYNLLFWVFHNVFARLHLISGQLDEKDYMYTDFRTYAVSFVKTLLGYRQRFAGAMWFLETVLLLSLVMICLDWIVMRFFPNKRMQGLAIGVFVVVAVNHLLKLSEISHVPDSFTKMLYWGINGLLFFYLGYAYKEYGLNEKLAKHKQWFSLILLVPPVIATFWVSGPIVSPITEESMSIFSYGLKALIGPEEEGGCSLLFFTLFSILTLCWILAVLLFSQFEIIQKCRLFTLLGQYSLHIMCLQFLAFKPVSFLIIRMYGLPAERLAEYPVLIGIEGGWWICYTVAACALPILAVKCYEKLKTMLRKSFIRDRI